MGLKDNFIQAMKELFGGESASDAAAEKQTAGQESPLFTREEPEQPPKAAESAPMSDTSLESQFEDRMRDMLKSSGLVGEDLQSKAQSETGLDSNLRKAESPVAPPAPPRQPVFTRDNEPERPAYSAPVRPAPAYAPPPAAVPPAAPPAYTPPPAVPAAPPAYAPSPAYTAPPAFTREAPVEPVRFARPLEAESAYAPNAPRYSSPYGQTEQESFPRSSTSGAEITVISKNTLVTGSIRSFAGIYVEGNVNGNIEVMKNADINGKIIGNVTCSDTRLNGALIQGDILSKGRVYMDKNAMLVGNMAGQSMDVDGKVKGNVEVGGRIGLRENSVVIGNINAGTIAISDGANVQGYINTTYLRENADKVFPAQISLADEESAFTQPGQ